ncbi:hypothetical protein GQ671_02140 [Salinicoccus hispanicus]|uniref:DUF2268 domain-containing protein n=2 Tax=Salinicoccus hispanicus TaxID=157225 RepID=A0A6N8TWM6_9STAP|nr:hypothetical protein [Salinicoccus hispanicus]
MYKEVFDTILDRLYMMPIEAILEIVENIDFDSLAEKAEAGIGNSDLVRLEDILIKCIRYYPFDRSFDVYILVGFGHIDGTALPSRLPFLYLGLERLKDRDIELLIQYEFNHMVRFHANSEFMTGTTLTVGQLVVAEGLATLAPLAMKTETLSEKAIAKSLFMESDEYENLKSNFKEIEKSIIIDFDKELSPRLM